jgi:sialic acid synthase SpsE
MNENVKKFEIDEKTTFSPKNPLIIADLGTGHNGDISRAKELISAAAEAGAGCIKFQTVFADEILHPNTGEVTLPGGKIRLYDRFKALEKPVEFYQEVKEYVESKGLLFLCTPFGYKSASILKGLSPKIVKIASPELNFTGLIGEIASWGTPILLSSGVSRLADIERAIEGIGSGEWGVGSVVSKCSNLPSRSDNEQQPYSLLPTPHSPICLLHCVTSYPAPETDYNLRLLPLLSGIFGVSVGVSDHSLDPCLVPALAVSLGACVVEKHFCLSREDTGLDDPIALPPFEFAQMARAVGRAGGAEIDETLEFFVKERGREFVERVLGSGVKELAESERANYRRTNRSIHAVRDIEAGEVLKKGDYAVLRTEKILRPGIEPCWEKLIEGRVVRNFIPAGEGIRFEDV